MAHGVVGDDLAVAVSGRETLSVEDWSEMERAFEKLVRPLRATRRLFKILVFADEATPNAKQRASIVGVLQGANARIAVVTSSGLARNVITAFGWLSMPVKSFAPAHLSNAAPYLEIPHEQLEQALSLAVTLADRVGRVECVDLAVAASKSVSRLR